MVVHTGTFGEWTDWRQCWEIGMEAASPTDRNDHGAPCFLGVGSPLGLSLSFALTDRITNRWTRAARAGFAS